MKTLKEIKNATNLLIQKTSSDGGIGEIWKTGKRYASVIWSNGGGWEHVSISPFNKRIMPDWDDMCNLKDMFFNDNETVVQYHPAKSEYVNNVSNCLHLWRPINEKIPTPPTIMVGIKQGQTPQEIQEAVKAVCK